MLYRNRSVVMWRWRKHGRLGDLVCKESWGNFLRVMDMFIILITVIISQLYAYVKFYQTLYFNHIQFSVRLLHLKNMLESCSRKAKGEEENNWAQLINDSLWDTVVSEKHLDENQRESIKEKLEDNVKY